MPVYAIIIGAIPAGNRLGITFLVAVIINDKIVTITPQASCDARKHPDAINNETLKTRVREILQGNPSLSQYANERIEIVAEDKLKSILGLYGIPLSN